MSEEIRKLKEQILKDYPRLDSGSEFTFSCHPGVPCFNKCCADVNIFLTPYDILRLRKALGITSGEFLSKYTLMPMDKNLKYPVIVLKMEENEAKTCHFVTEKGCGVYGDRPWSCRMYPLGLASPKEGHAALDREFYFLLKEAVCKGFDEAKKWTVAEWLKNQGIETYDEMGREFKDITLHRFFEGGGQLNPKKVDMFFMACYDMDKFRGFVFESSFLDKFEVDEETQGKIKDDDVELLRFGYRWLRFSLFGEKTVKVKGEILEAKKEALKKQGKTLPHHN